MSAEQSEAMAAASPFRFDANGESTAWEWGSGPIVVLVHGWGGRAAQMAPLAVHVAEQGFRAIALDVTGHGESRRRRTKWAYFLRDIEALSAGLKGPIYAYIGHSAGGMTMMAARYRNRISGQRFVCICAPSYPFPPVRAVRARLNPRGSVLSLYQDDLADQFGIPWRKLISAEYFMSAGKDLLLVYDERDRFVPHSEGNQIERVTPGSTLIKTNSYGHQRILSAPELFTAVTGFFAAATSKQDDVSVGPAPI